MAYLQSHCEQPECMDDRKLSLVRDGDELRFLRSIYSRDRRFIARVELHHAGVLVNDLWLVIAHPVDLVRDFVVLLPANEDAHELAAAKSDATPFDPFTGAAVVGKGIEEDF